jgi:hypothetical protein
VGGKNGISDVRLAGNVRADDVVAAMEWLFSDACENGVSEERGARMHTHALGRVSGYAMYRTLFKQRNQLSNK